MPETTPGIAPIAAGVNPPLQETRQQSGQPEARNIPERVSTPRESLLIWKQKQELADAIKSHDTIILAAGTGTGKTRGGSQIALEALGPDARMVVTENLRRATEESARVVAGDMQVEIGKEVGIRNRYSHEFSDQTKLLFCPVQSLLVMMEDDPLLERYNLVAMDEVHKESKANELCMIRLRDIQAQRKAASKPDLKLMFISATADQEKIKTHFPDAFPVNVEGKMYPVDKTFETRDFKPEELPRKAADKVKASIAAGDKGDILVFLSGKAQIDEAAKELASLTDVTVIPYYSAASKDEQDSIFAEGGKRRVILATNAAQEGLTIDVNIVVDTGMHKHMEMDISTGRQVLTERKAPQDHITQRMGRVGRKESKFPGQNDKYYALFTEPDLKSRPAHEPAEMQRTDIMQEMLILMAQGNDVRSFHYINAPSPTNINLALDRLKKIGALNEDGKISEKGKLMAELQIRPNLAGMMVSAAEYGAVKRAGALAAMLETYEDALDTKNGTASAFKNPDSDALGFIQIFQAYRNIKGDGERKAWAKKNNLNFWKLRDAGRLYDEMLRTLRAKYPGMNPDADEPSLALDRSIFDGFADGYVKLDRDQKYFVEGAHVEIDKRSSLFGKKPARFVTFQVEPQMKDGVVTMRRAKLNHPIPEEVTMPAPAETAKPAADKPVAAIPEPVTPEPPPPPAAPKEEAPPEAPPPPPPKPPTFRERFKNWFSGSIFGKVWRWITK